MFAIGLTAAPSLILEGACQSFAAAMALDTGISALAAARWHWNRSIPQHFWAFRERAGIITRKSTLNGRLADRLCGVMLPP
jgi:hypothetical protein